MPNFFADPRIQILAKNLVLGTYLNRYMIRAQIVHVNVENFIAGNVTRFGEISPLWHNFKIIGNFMRVKLVFGKLLNLLWKIQCAFGPIYVVVSAQTLRKPFRHPVTLITGLGLLHWLLLGLLPASRVLQEVPPHAMLRQSAGSRKKETFGEHVPENVKNEENVTNVQNVNNVSKK